MRGANEIDMWRGLALVSIFVNHIPGFAFERFTHRNYGLSDSAELFVFLAGWSLRRLADGSAGREGLPPLLARLGGRAVALYAAQVLITVVATGMVAGAALAFANPLLLGWTNAGAIFSAPVEAHVGLALLTHQLGYFDILPLYVVLMATAAPAIVALHRVAPAAVLPLSLAVYVATLATEINLPTWPVEGVWYFNPLAWQAVFTLGFALGNAGSGVGAAVRRHRGALRIVGAAGVALGLALALSDYAPDPLAVPQPILFFVFDKTYLSPARLLHFLALAAAFGGAFLPLSRVAPLPVRALSMLGRHSLNVFCIGSLMSLAGQLVRYRFGGSLAVDGAVLIAGCAALGLAAWLSDLRNRPRAAAATSSPPSSSRSA